MSQPTRYRKKPVTVDAALAADAIKAAATSWADLPAWLTAAYETGNVIFLPDAVLINTLEGQMRANADDWIICGTRGELYPCKPGPFADTFEPVDGAS